MDGVDDPVFLAPRQVSELAAEFGTPLFVYDEQTLVRKAQEALAFQAPFGLTVRYAMKANPSAAIVRLFDGLGLHIDASSGFEVERAILAGIAPEKIMLTSQELPQNLEALVRQGVLYNATSLHQLESYGKLFAGSALSLRINPGLGSGHSKHVNTGGLSSSFGIWHEQIDEAKQLLERYDLTATKIHTHIGSGSDPAVWQRVVKMSLAMVARFPSAVTLNLGGGYKVARMREEVATDLQDISAVAKAELEQFARDSGRKIHLEIEPGSYLVANAGALVGRIQDITDTGADGYRFIKLDAGMTEILRPSLYGAQHPIVVVGKGSGTDDYVVVGHCCESGDILTPAAGEPGALATRRLQRAQIGDNAVIEAVGAYCASMGAAGYNSFPAAAEVLLAPNNKARLIRKRQTLGQLIENEITPD